MRLSCRDRSPCPAWCRLDSHYLGDYFGAALYIELDNSFRLAGEFCGRFCKRKVFSCTTMLGFCASNPLRRLLDEVQDRIALRSAVWTAHSGANQTAEGVAIFGTAVNKKIFSVTPLNTKYQRTKSFAADAITVGRQCARPIWAVISMLLPGGYGYGNIV